jgi:signal transduction histidine kinase
VRIGGQWHSYHGRGRRVAILRRLPCHRKYRSLVTGCEGFSRALEESVDSLDKVLAPGGNGNGKEPARDGAPSPVRSQLREEIRESLDFILRSVAKMDFLVRGLLELSRIDSRPGLSQPIDLGRVVEEVVGSLHYHISERGIRVDVDPLPVVVGDSMRINQVFGNLIDNAVKYMKPEGEARIHIGHRREDDVECFFVRDSGIGIRPEDHGKIFRLFTRIAGSAVAGDGLGLTAVKKILDKHGGTIWVESEPGEGSTFWFTLPREAGEERADGHAAQRVD